MSAMGLHIDYLTGRMVSEWLQTPYSTPSIHGEWGHTGEDFSGSFSDENIVENVQSSSGLVSCTGVSRQMLKECASRVQTGCPPWTTLPQLCLFQRPNMQVNGPSLAQQSSDHLAPWEISHLQQSSVCHHQLRQQAKLGSFRKRGARRNDCASFPPCKMAVQQDETRLSCSRFCSSIMT